MDMTPTPSAELRELWQRAAEGALPASDESPRRGVARRGVRWDPLLRPDRLPRRPAQRELLQRFHAEGLDCEPKLG